MKEKTVASVRATIPLLRSELEEVESSVNQTRELLGLHDNLTFAIHALEVLLRFAP